MLQLNPTNRNAGYCCTGSAGMCACLFYFLPTSCTGIIATGSADIFTITHVWLCATGPAYMPESSSYFCNSFRRLAGMLQCLYFKRCFERTGMFVTVAIDHLTHRSQLNSTSMSVSVASTSRYVWISCNWLTSTSVVVWPNQQVYMLHLPQTCSYVPMLVPN